MGHDDSADTMLVPMTDDEFAAYVEAAVRDYACDKVLSGQWSEAQALSLARADYAESLPQGLGTPGNFLYTLRDARSGGAVGVFWYACQDRAGRQVAYVHDVLVHPEHQRRGHAMRAFNWLEREVRERGLSGIALHVFGHNTGAQALYARLGFRPTNINMFRPVPP